MRKVLFRPYPISEDKEGLNKWLSGSQKKWHYAPNGRSALYHILLSLRAKKILVPAFICLSVIEAIRWAKVRYEFYDLSSGNLLPSVDSLESLLKTGEYDTVLWPTLYGQPFALDKVSQVCEKYKARLIDDAAQAFGATFSGKPVGEFGDAGFFSFSPGKPTSTAMGAFFWSREPVQIERTRHGLFHYFKHFEFRINRLSQFPILRILKIGKILALLNAKLSKMNFYYSDDIEKFETPVLSGIISRETSKTTIQNRQSKFNKIAQTLDPQTLFTIVKGEGEGANPHKCVLYFSNQELCNSLKMALSKADIFFGNGYRSLSLGCPVSSAITHLIVELPIDYNENEFSELLLVLKTWRTLIK